MSNFIQSGIKTRLSKEVDVVAIFKRSGMKPLKFCIDGKVINIDKVDCVNDSRILGEDYRIFKCQSYIDNVEKIYELKFVINTFKWYLL